MDIKRDHYLQQLIDYRADGKRAQVVREIDFVANKSGERAYIQSAYALATKEKNRLN